MRQSGSRHPRERSGGCLPYSVRTFDAPPPSALWPSSKSFVSQGSVALSVVLAVLLSSHFSQHHLPVFSSSGIRNTLRAFDFVQRFKNPPGEELRTGTRERDRRFSVRLRLRHRDEFVAKEEDEDSEDYATLTAE